MSCTLSGITLSSTTGTINLSNSSTNIIYGAFTGDTSGDLTILSGNNSATITLNTSAVIINNPNNSSATGSIYIDYGANLNITTPQILNLNSTNQITLDSNNATINLQSKGTQFGSFTSNNGSLTISSSSLNGGNINFGNYGYVNATSGFTISSVSGYSLNLNSNSNGTGTINLQNGGTTYGKISNDNGLHIQSLGSNDIVIDSINDIYFYSSTLHLQPTGGGTQYGSFSGDTSGDLTISSGGGTTALNGSIVTTNYTAGWNTSGSGIINQQALGSYLAPFRTQLPGFSPPGTGPAGPSTPFISTIYNPYYNNNCQQTFPIVLYPFIVAGLAGGVYALSIYDILNSGMSCLYFVNVAGNYNGNSQTVSANLLNPNVNPYLEFTWNFNTDNSIQNITIVMQSTNSTNYSVSIMQIG